MIFAILIFVLFIIVSKSRGIVAERHGQLLYDVNEGNEYEARSMNELVDYFESSTRKVSAIAYKNYMGDRVTAKQMEGLTDKQGFIKNPTSLTPKGARGNDPNLICSERPDFEEFTGAEKKEMMAFVHREVFSAPMTRKQRLAAGVRDIDPVPLMKIYEMHRYSAVYADTDI